MLYNMSIQKGSLHISARNSILSLMPRKISDLHYIKSLRPIVLLIASHLKSVLDFLIAPHQTGFMKGRHIVQNIQKMLDIIEYSEEHKMPALIVSIDFEKCFDCVEYESMYQAMRYFNFGENLIKWVEIVLEGFLIYTQNAGFLSEWISPQKALFQGAPTSPYLYLLLGQVLSDRLL